MADRTVLTPVEDKFHKYPVMKIPIYGGKSEFIIGVEKAQAVLIYRKYIEDFVRRHTQKDQNDG